MDYMNGPARPDQCILFTGGAGPGGEAMPTMWRLLRAGAWGFSDACTVT